MKIYRIETKKPQRELGLLSGDAGIRRKSTGLAPPDSRCISTEQKKPGEQAGLFFVVEMPGIEPGSLGEDLVILRAQFGLAFLCPDVHPNEMSTGTATV